MRGTGPESLTRYAQSLALTVLLASGCASSPDNSAADATVSGRHAGSAGVNPSVANGAAGGGGLPGTGGNGTDGSGSGASGAAGTTGSGGVAAGSGGDGSGGTTGNVGGGSSGVAGTGNLGGAGTGGVATGGAGSTTGGAGPCDILLSGGTPCVSAHSTVRALSGAYSGSLYQVRRASDQTTKDVAVLSAGGFANSVTQDTFCAGTSCTISIIYDQSGKGNHLTKAPGGGNKPTPDNEANATDLKLTVSGHTVYGVHIPVGVGYRNNQASGLATGDQPETMYMVTSGTYYNGGCCFDYGNAETNSQDDGPGTMEAVYFGDITRYGKGAGKGPWVLADLEKGVFAGPNLGVNSSDTPLTSSFVTAMLTGLSGSFVLKGGNGQSGKLTTMYDGARPSGYDPMKKQGAIILGTGGDNSSDAEGNFLEGVMAFGAASDAIDDALQANVIAAGYGR